MRIASPIIVGCSLVLMQHGTAVEYERLGNGVHPRAEMIEASDARFVVDLNWGPTAGIDEGILFQGPNWFLDMFDDLDFVEVFISPFGPFGQAPPACLVGLGTDYDNNWFRIVLPGTKERRFSGISLIPGDRGGLPVGYLPDQVLPLTRLGNSPPAGVRADEYGMRFVYGLPYAVPDRGLTALLFAAFFAPLTFTRRGLRRSK